MTDPDINSAPLSRRKFLAAAGMAAAGLLLKRPKRAAARSYVQCPILMYHYISDPPPEAGALRIDLSVGPAQFAGHLDLLRSEGFTAITLADLAAALQDASLSLPEKPVVLTFDDGYADAFHQALPLLLERGMVGTFFVVSGFMEQGGYLTWQQVLAMQQAGMEIGSHSQTHPNLAIVDAATQQAEIEGAAATLETVLGTRPQTFCYPFGRYSTLTMRLVRASGHRCAVTTRDGTVQYPHYPFSMSRVRIRHTTSPAALRWLVNRHAW